MREDRFTHTEADAGLYERQRAQDDYDPPDIDRDDDALPPEAYGKDLQTMREEIAAANHAAGWRGPDAPPVTFGESIALLHSEVSEALEAYRRWGLDDATDAHFADSKPEGVGSELADVLIRLLDTCDRFDVNLPYEYERKIAHNRTRSHRHGGKRL